MWPQSSRPDEAYRDELGNHQDFEEWWCLNHFDNLDMPEDLKVPEGL